MNEHHPYQIGDSPLCYRVLHTHLSKDRVPVKTNLDNYDNFTDPRKHI